MNLAMETRSKRALRPIGIALVSFELVWKMVAEITPVSLEPRPSPEDSRRIWHILGLVIARTYILLWDLDNHTGERDYLLDHVGTFSFF